MNSANTCLVCCNYHAAARVRVPSTGSRRLRTIRCAIVFLDNLARSLHAHRPSKTGRPERSLEW